MTRASSDVGGRMLGVDPPAWGPHGQAQMVVRLLAHPPDPLVDGGAALRVLEAQGRRSGRSRYTPLEVLQWDQAWWLVAPDRARDWVHNLVAGPQCALLAGNAYQPRQAVPAEPVEAVPIVVAYLAAVSVPWIRAGFAIHPGMSRSEILHRIEAMTVFRLTPTSP